MKKLELIATATFGVEAVVKREIEELGYEIIKSEDAKITFGGDEEAIVKSNLWLRCADRILLKMGEFEARTFEDLFQGTKALPWEEWITEDGKFTVNGSSVKSDLFSISDCQSIVKKAIVERLKQHYKTDWFKETGAEFPVKVTLLKDRATLTIDTSGVGLHKRGYRVVDVKAPIKETLGAALVKLSFFKAGRLLVDPFCGSGTIAIEAAMIAKNIAPGLSRKFAAEGWPAIPKELWQKARKEAFESIDNEKEVRIIASDISKRAIEAAMENAEEAGVLDCIEFITMPVKDLVAKEEFGIIICNPPYGERIGERADLDEIYRDMGSFFKLNPTWSLYFLTSDKEFEKQFKRTPADRRRKLYNGRIEATYYQYMGEKPKNEQKNPL